MDELEERLRAIELRNERVEGNKAWETSYIRRFLIVSITYVVVLLYGLAIGIRRPALSAAIPAAGFFISTLTLPAVKENWLRRRSQSR